MRTQQFKGPTAEKVSQVPTPKYPLAALPLDPAR